jgi:endonuclease/exonuclease/phosphatase family metal-dependent hydrolase
VTHPQFDDGGRPGTFANGSASQKIDYVLLSPKLFKKMKKGGIFRMGVWGGVNGTLFPHFPEITKKEEAASDHAAVWADIDI